MKIQHLNLNTMCPWGGPLVQTTSGLFDWKTKYISHSLLIETNDGLVLVDAGFSVDDIKNPKRFPAAYNLVINPQYQIEESALHQIEKLGFKKEDVRHILPTHLDLDHAGGIADFPNATVHIYKPEYEAAMNPNSWKENARYLFDFWRHQPSWETYQTDGDKWFGFEAVRSLAGLPPEILLIPLAGHTRGHCAVAVQTGDRWLLHAGDAYFHHGSISQPNTCPLGVGLFEGFIAADSKQLRINQRRLSELATHNRENVSVFCAHDEFEFKSITQGKHPR